VRLAVRVGLVVVGVAAIVYLGLGWRAASDETTGISYVLHHRATPAAVAASRRKLKDAERNNADTRPLLLQGELYIFARQPRRAIVPLREVVRREPENFEGWRLLANAAAAGHLPALARRAQAQTLRLSPPVPTR
jgi:predicted Zn-dependent protease